MGEREVEVVIAGQCGEQRDRGAGGVEGRVVFAAREVGVGEQPVGLGGVGHDGIVLLAGSERAPQQRQGLGRACEPEQGAGGPALEGRRDRMLLAVGGLAAGEHAVDVGQGRARVGERVGEGRLGVDPGEHVGGIGGGQGP